MASSTPASNALIPGTSHGSASALAAKGERGKKFQSLNINNLYQGSAHRPQNKSAPHKQGLQSLGKVPTARRAPANLPSLKSETGTVPGLDPTAGNGWIGKDDKTSGEAADGEKKPALGHPRHEPAKLGSANGPDKLWPGRSRGHMGGGGQSFLNQRSPLFGQEFPTLQNQEAASAATVVNGVGITLKPGGGRGPAHGRDLVQSENKYGPGPALRPQTAGTWAHGGGASPSDPTPASVSAPIMGKPLGPDPAYEAVTGAKSLPSGGLPASGISKTESFLSHFDVSTTGGPPIPSGSLTGVDIRGKKAGYLGKKGSDMSGGARGGVSGDRHQHPSRTRVVAKDPTFQGSIIDHEKLLRMDVLETCEDDWTRSDEDFDYNKKLASDDELEEGKLASEEHYNLNASKSIGIMPSDHHLKTSSQLFHGSRQQPDSGDWMKSSSGSLNNPPSSNFHPPDAADLALSMERRFESEEEHRRIRKKEEVLKNIERARRRREEEESKYCGSASGGAQNQHQQQVRLPHQRTSPGKVVPSTEKYDNTSGGMDERHRSNSTRSNNDSRDDHLATSMGNMHMNSKTSGTQRYKRQQQGEISNQQPKSSPSRERRLEIMKNKPNVGNFETPRGRGQPNDVEAEGDEHASIGHRSDLMSQNCSNRQNACSGGHDKPTAASSRDPYSIHPDDETTVPMNNPSHHHHPSSNAYSSTSQDHGLFRDSKEGSPPLPKGKQQNRGGKFSRGGGRGGGNGGPELDNHKPRDSARGAQGNRGHASQNSHGGSGPNSTNWKGTDPSPREGGRHRRDQGGAFTGSDVGVTGGDPNSEFKQPGWFVPRGQPSRRGRGNHAQSAPNHNHQRSPFPHRDQNTNSNSTSETGDALSDDSHDDNFVEDSGRGHQQSHAHSGRPKKRSDQGPDGPVHSRKGPLYESNPAEGLDGARKGFSSEPISAGNNRRGPPNANRHDANAPKRHSPKQQPQQQQQMFDRRQNKLPPRLAKQREQSRLSFRGSGSLMPGSNSRPLSDEEYGTMGGGSGHHQELWSNRADSNNGPLEEGIRSSGSAPGSNHQQRPLESCIDESNPHHEHQHQQQPVQTIIFENTNFRKPLLGGPPAHPGHHSQMSGNNGQRLGDSSSNQGSSGGGGGSLPYARVKPEETNSDLKFDFGFDSDISSHPPQTEGGENVGDLVRHGKNGSGSLQHPATEDLNKKIASVKKVWESSFAAPPSGHDSRGGSGAKPSSHFGLQDTHGSSGGSKQSDGGSNMMDNPTDQSGGDRGSDGTAGAHMYGTADKPSEGAPNNIAKVKPQQQSHPSASSANLHAQSGITVSHHPGVSGGASSSHSIVSNNSGHPGVSVSSGVGGCPPIAGLMANNNAGPGVGGNLPPTDYDRRAAMGYNRLVNSSAAMSGAPLHTSGASILAGQTHSLYQAFQLDGRNQLYPAYPGMGQSMLLQNPSTAAGANDMFGPGVAGGHNQFRLGHNPGAGGAQYAPTNTNAMIMPNQQANLLNSKGQQHQGSHIGPIGSKASGPGNSNSGPVAGFHQGSNPLSNLSANPVSSPLLIPYDNSGNPINYHPRGGGGQSGQTAFYQAFAAANSQAQSSGRQQTLGLQGFNVSPAGIQSLAASHVRAQHPQSMGMSPYIKAGPGGDGGNGFESNAGRGGGMGAHPVSAADEMAYNPTPIQRPQGGSS
eukprot:maker-scaffold491_size156641-snap-gene-0.38 protein:Tk05485 transcript:maker-scaffold491_size156641-snap-gene-0.38-mRNA-1 annotation:"protein bat2-like"